MAGWRVGLVCGKREYIDNILKVKSNMDSGMFLPLQEAAVQAFKNSAEWHNAQNKEYACRRDYAYELLDILQCTYSKNQVGMFIWAKVPDSIENVESFVDNILYKAKVFITPGFIFGSRGERYIRISLCSGVEVFKEVIKRIREV